MDCSPPGCSVHGDSPGRNTRVSCHALCVLATVNSTALTVTVNISFEILISIPLEIYPRMGLTDHVRVLFLIFEGTFILFSIVAAPIYISINSVQGFSFLYNLKKTYLLLL